MITSNPKHSEIVLVDSLIVPSMNMKSRPKKAMNFISVFRPLYYLSRVWSLASFSIATNSNGELHSPKIHLFDGLWLSTNILIYLLFAYEALNMQKSSEENLSERTWVLMVSVHLLELFGSIYGILVIIMNVRNRFKLISLVNLYLRFDKEVFIYVWLTTLSLQWRFHFSPQMIKWKVHFDYEHDHRRTKLICIASMILIVLFPSVSLYVRKKSSWQCYLTHQLVFHYCLLLFQLAVRLIPCLLYTIFIHNLQKRYEALNLLLRYGI